MVEITASVKIFIGQKYPSVKISIGQNITTIHDYLCIKTINTVVASGFGVDEKLLCCVLYIMRGLSVILRSLCVAIFAHEKLFVAFWHLG